MQITKQLSNVNLRVGLRFSRKNQRSNKEASSNFAATINFFAISQTQPIFPSTERAECSSTRQPPNSSKRGPIYKSVEEIQSLECPKLQKIHTNSQRYISVALKFENIEMLQSTILRGLQTKQSRSSYQHTERTFAGSIPVFSSYQIIL